MTIQIIDLIAQGLPMATLSHPTGCRLTDLPVPPAVVSHLAPWRSSPRAGVSLRDRQFVTVAVQSLTDYGFEVV